jgi:hypothetical protein
VGFLGIPAAKKVMVGRAEFPSSSPNFDRALRRTEHPGRAKGKKLVKGGN